MASKNISQLASDNSKYRMIGGEPKKSSLFRHFCLIECSSGDDTKHYHVTNFNERRFEQSAWEALFPHSCEADKTHQRIKIENVWRAYVEM